MRLLPSHRRLILEVTLLELSHPESTVDLGQLAARLESLESRLGSTSVPAASPAFEAGQVPSATAEVSSGQTTPPQPDEAAPVVLQPQPPPATTGPTSRTPGASSGSAADVWEAFLQELQSVSHSLHSIVLKRGNLESYRSGRAVVKLNGLTPDEGAMITERRNQKLVNKVFSSSAGKDVQVDFEDTAQTRPGSQDPFTEEIARSFDGRIID
jgi:hypothetical protein